MFNNFKHNQSKHRTISLIDLSHILIVNLKMHLATLKACLVHTDLVFGIYTVEC